MGRPGDEIPQGLNIHSLSLEKAAKQGFAGVAITFPGPVIEDRLHLVDRGTKGHGLIEAEQIRLTQGEKGAGGGQHLLQAVGVGVGESPQQADQIGEAINGTGHLDRVAEVSGLAHPAKAQPPFHGLEIRQRLVTVHRIAARGVVADAQGEADGGGLLLQGLHDRSQRKGPNEDVVIDEKQQLVTAWTPGAQPQPILDPAPAGSGRWLPQACQQVPPEGALLHPVDHQSALELLLQLGVSLGERLGAGPVQHRDRCLCRLPAMQGKRREGRLQLQRPVLGEHEGEGTHHS